MKQKIIKIGNSQGIILSKETLEAAGLKPGDDVYVIPDPNAGTLIVSDKDISHTYTHDLKFKNSSQKVLETYKNAWKKLSNINEN